MAIIYKCDHCGKVLTYDELKRMVTVKQHYNYTDGYGDVNVVNHEYHLCNDCFHKIKKLAESLKA